MKIRTVPPERIKELGKLLGAKWWCYKHQEWHPMTLLQCDKGEKFTIKVFENE